jgi:hypothetical protein
MVKIQPAQSRYPRDRTPADATSRCEVRPVTQYRSSVHGNSEDCINVLPLRPDALDEAEVARRAEEADARFDAHIDSMPGFRKDWTTSSGPWVSSMPSWTGLKGVNLPVRRRSAYLDQDLNVQIRSLRLAGGTQRAGC